MVGTSSMLMVKGDFSGIAPQFPKLFPQNKGWFRLQLESLARNSRRCKWVGWKMYKTAAPAIFKRLKNTLKSNKCGIGENQGKWLLASLKVTQEQSTGIFWSRDSFRISVLPSGVCSANRESEPDRRCSLSVGKWIKIGSLEPRWCDLPCFSLCEIHQVEFGTFGLPFTCTLIYPFYIVVNL